MERKLKAEGDTWSVRLGSEPSAPDRQLVVFFCRTTDQRPYRVVEIPRERVPGPEAFAALSDDELHELFVAARSMGYPQEYPTYPS